MGRRKIEIKAIKDDRNRSVTFLKRKGGLFKKAHELSVLCSVDVAVFIFGSNKKLYEYSSSDMRELIHRYTYHGGPNEHKGPSDFNGGNDEYDDEDENGASPPRDGSLDHGSNAAAAAAASAASHLMPPHYQAQLPPHIRNQTPSRASSSPPMSNGVPFQPGHHVSRGHTPQPQPPPAQIGSRPGSRNDMRRMGGLGVGPQQQPQQPMPPHSGPHPSPPVNGFAYMPQPAIYQPPPPHHQPQVQATLGTGGMQQHQQHQQHQHQLVQQQQPHQQQPHQQPHQQHQQQQIQHQRQSSPPLAAPASVSPPQYPYPPPPPPPAQAQIQPHPHPGQMSHQQSYAEEQQQPPPPPQQQHRASLPPSYPSHGTPRPAHSRLEPSPRPMAAPLPASSVAHMTPPPPPHQRTPQPMPQQLPPRMGSDPAQQQQPQSLPQSLPQQPQPADMSPPPPPAAIDPAEPAERPSLHPLKTALKRPTQRKGRSIFTPIDENRSILSQHFSSFVSEPQLVRTDGEGGGRSQSVDNGAVMRKTGSPPLLPPRANSTATRRPRPEPIPEEDSFPPPPSRSNSVSMLSGPLSAGVKPRLRVQIPDEGSESGTPIDGSSGGGGGGGSAPASTTEPNPLSAVSSAKPGAGIVLPPPSPSASALLSAGATGPPNPFARPPPQNNNGTGTGMNIDTPVSALPSRFLNNEFLPSPSGFYPDWNFRGGEGNTLPSPLNFATPVAGSGPSFLLRDDGGIGGSGGGSGGGGGGGGGASGSLLGPGAKRKSPEITGDMAEAKRVKVE